MLTVKCIVNNIFISFSFLIINIKVIVPETLIRLYVLIILFYKLYKPCLYQINFFFLDNETGKFNMILVIHFINDTEKIGWSRFFKIIIIV